ncbi:DNA -binding domain-containing protein [Sphingomonas sp. S2-65]|uniref:DNA -binding domain-containing protein n=1 Tax=Sphingomonas sp. S2-65 TaxID=2903960 RepID=UPI0039B6EE35
MEILRVGDAIAAGASYHEMAVALYGEERVRAEWKGRSNFLMSGARRRAEDAARMAVGGWRALLRS